MIHLTSDHKVTVCFLAFLTDAFPIKDSFVNVARNMPNFNVCNRSLDALRRYDFTFAELQWRCEPAENRQA